MDERSPDTFAFNAFDAADDPGWYLHEVLLDGAVQDRWLYEYADGSFVDEDGSPFEVGPAGFLAPVDDEAAPPDDRPADDEPPDDEPPDDEPPDDEPADDEPAGDEPADDEPTDDGPAAGASAHAPRGGSRPAVSVLVPAVVAVVVIAAAVTVLSVLAARRGGTGDPPAASRAARLTLPAAVAPDTELVRSRILDSGDIRVDHWIARTRPLTRVVVPPAVSPGDRPVGVERVLVETPEGEVPGAAGAGAGSRDYALDGVRQVRVSYVLTGAVRRSGDGGRALASPTSLDLEYPGDPAPRTVEILGGRLLSAACTADPTAMPRPCGQPEGSSWRVRLEPAERDDLVMAQLDLR